uniref:leucine-rich repeat- and IQ domain-containing protein 1 n=1 Tax=Centroberyx gerrardi TaxID=166262 RepID=UPI003AAAAA7D
MTAANEMDEALMQELSKLVFSDAELETNEEEGVYLFHEDEASDEIPQSMLSYFDSLTSRAAVCETLRLGDLEDPTAPHRSEDTKDLPSDPDEDLAMLNERVTGETENEESSSTSPVTSLPPAATETEPLLTHHVSVCLNNEDEVEGDEYLERLAVELRAHESSVKEEEEKKHTEYQAEREKRQREEREEEQRRLRERDFEEELRKIEEAEKLCQKDVEMTEKRAQDKLEQELLQQQELISNLQRQVEEERRREEEERKNREEEEKRRKEEERKTKEEEKRKRQEEEKKKREESKKRKKEEEENRKMAEERKKMEAERRKMEEEVKRKEEEEENRKREEEIRLKEEEERRKKEKDEREKRDEEAKRRKEEERITMEAERKKMEEETRRNEEEENRKREEEIRLKEEERKKRDEEEKRKREKEIRKREVEIRLKEEERKTEDGEKRKRQEEENKKREEEKNRKREVEIRLTEEEERKKRDEEEKTKREEEIGKREKTEDGGDSTETPGQKSRHASMCETVNAGDPAASSSSPMCLPERTEHRRLSWMRDCTPWSKLSLQNRRKQRGPARSRRGARRPAEAGGRLPPLCPDALLRSGGCKSPQEVTTVRLEDLPGCSLPSPAQCPQLRSLTLRRCGLKALDGVSRFPQLCYVDVQENDITFVDCENMASLRVLRLGRNRLTSIHGLSGADNLDVLELSYNSITRIAGLESMKRLQRLSVDHNQLISTKGLREVYTLLHLDCSHNHLTSVEGLENCALLSTLDVRANSLTEAPGLKNQVLLRELHLDDNSISSLQGLAACWLPLLHHLSLAQNSITQLPSMSDCVSLVNLDLRHNCLSELRSVCESLEGCPLLREIHLTGNPLQQESGWRSTLQKAVPGLRAIDGRETIPSLSPPAVDGGGLPSDSFLAFCQAQLQQTHDLQQQHSRELSGASSPLGAVKTSCRHFTEALQLAEDQRFAHEYGDTTVSDTHRAADQTPPEETLHTDSTDATKLTERPEMESPGNREAHEVPALSPAGDNGRSRTFENTAAVVIQQHWRKHRQKCGNISRPPTAEKGGGRGGDGGNVASGPPRVERSVVGLDYAATVIQAFWRGFALRKRLASALAWAAAAARPDTGEEDGFEEVDLDEFVFDEAALEKDWTLLLSEDSPPRMHPVSDQPLSPKVKQQSWYIFPPPLPWRPKQAWVSGEQVDSAGQRVSPEGTNRTKSPASTSMLSGLSERSEKILEEWGFTDSRTALLMLKRARKMKSQKQRQKKLMDPSVRLALFRSCTYQLGPVEAGKRPAPDKRDYLKVGEAELGLQQAEQVRLKQERTYQWLHSQAAPPDRHSESERFLPEIDPDVLNGGRVQLVAGPGYRERPDQASGLWANSSSASQPRKEHNYPRRNSWGHARKEVPSPQRVPSVPSKKERISYRDSPVQLSGGWGGGKKRDKVCK